jgi:hypothetical protein
MQNFPEQMNTFNSDESYGLTQLNALKAPFKPFVDKGDIENQVFNLSDYASLFTPSPGPTPFNLLLPIANLSSVPLFPKDKLRPQLQTASAGGGKKQRRLLPPRPKKRKTIKKRPNATTSTSKTTKKNKRYTNNKNNNKTKKNKPMKPISTKANQKRNKKHKRTIRRG